MAPRRQIRRPKARYALLFIVAALVLTIALLTWTDLHPYLAWFAGCNLITLVAFRLDKSWAKRTGAERVPEVVLLGLTLAGGVLGAGLGMILPERHKVNKAIFTVALMLGGLAHIYLIYMIFD